MLSSASQTGLDPCPREAQQLSLQDRPAQESSRQERRLEWWFLLYLESIIRAINLNDFRRLFLKPIQWLPCWAYSPPYGQVLRQTSWAATEPFLVKSIMILTVKNACRTTYWPTPVLLSASNLPWYPQLGWGEGLVWFVTQTEETRDRTPRLLSLLFSSVLYVGHVRTETVRGLPAPPVTSENILYSFR